ncbi:MAG: nucleoside monophosphate kinase [Patescibacteria group bacterium]|nr:nucleoside monophosphate kinase [Patescibacteria group bacterium]
MEKKHTIPLFKTKVDNLNQTFRLTDPKEQKEYFEAKAGEEIKKLQTFLKNGSFIVYLLGKKNAGKGTYAKMFAEVVGRDKVDHISVGDIVRELDHLLETKEGKEKLRSSLEPLYRGWISFDEVLDRLEKRSTKNLLPTEFILALIKREIAKREKKAIFVDGFPRDLDQISYSLFFRDLIGYRDDPDIFAVINVPTAVIDERIKLRRICPICKTSRNLKLLPTSKIGYREKEKEFFLQCDDSDCKEAEMVAKEGDELGTLPIQERLKTDEKLMNQAMSLYGIPKVLLRNTIPVASAKEYVDDYEITPVYSYEWDEKEQKVRVIEEPWVVNDDEGVPSYSLLPPPVTVSLIKQMVKALNLA